MNVSHQNIWLDSLSGSSQLSNQVFPNSYENSLSILESKFCEGLKFSKHKYAFSNCTIERFVWSLASKVLGFAIMCNNSWYIYKIVAEKIQPKAYGQYCTSIDNFEI